MTIQQHLHNQQKRYLTLFRVDIDGNGYYVENDILIPRKKFEERYPLATSFTQSKNINCDSTRNWLRDE